MSDIKVAIAGNPNVGKTTLFNALTGSNQHIGNWPGKTVEKKEGFSKFKNKKIKFVDLPGTYSLTAYSFDEVVARDYILDENPDVVVHIVDATNLERNMYLTTQLMELGANIVLAFNMYDLVRSRDIYIDIERISKSLGIPIVPLVASKKQGIEKLLKKIDEASKNKNSTKNTLNYGKNLEKKINKIQKTLQGVSKYPKRWLAIKILENDENALKFVDSLDNRNEILNVKKSIVDRDTETDFPDKRYEFVSSFTSNCIKKPKKLGIYRSDMLDHVVTHKYFGIPIFLVIMWLTFQLTFTVATPLMDLIDMGFAELATYVNNNISPDWFASFLGNGLIGGVGFVLIFLPNIFILFFVLSLLEDSGYLARVAFVMDRLMTYLGLHGRSFIPMMLGFGCNIPGIMATRTIKNRTDRMITILSAPFVSCSARLPVYLVLAGAFFSKHAATVVYLLYILGLVVAIGTAKILRMTLFKGEPSPFIMELPSYKSPTMQNSVKHTWNRGSLYLRKAGSIILLGAVIIWLFSSLPWGAEYGSEETYIADIGKVFEPLVEPLGFDWRIAVALIFGFVAKEIVVGALGVLYGVGEEDPDAISDAIESNPTFSPLIALEVMVFTLIYSPCLAAVGVIKQETGSWKWTGFSVVYSTLLAYVAALLIHVTGSAMGY